MVYQLKLIHLSKKMVISICKKVGKHQNEPKKTSDQDLAWKLGGEKEKSSWKGMESPLSPNSESQWELRD